MGEGKKLATWVADGSGLGVAVDAARSVGEKLIPANLSWLYTMGSLALFYFGLQIFTGCLLMTMYVPDETLAFQSLQTIEHRAGLGWLIRQMHAWGASFIVIVLLLHILKVLWHGSYKRPREFTWFVGFLLLATTLGFCFSGYLLPWNQLAFWATRVAVAAVDAVPLVGPHIKTFLCGSADVSGATIGRFFALHVVVLPGVLLVLVIWHLALLTYKGASPKTSVSEELELGHEAALWRHGAESFFPRQVYRDLFACNIGFALLVTVATLWPWELGEPASTETPPGIKPEWYFLPMYQFLKYFDDNLYGALPFLQAIRLSPEFLGVLSIGLVSTALFFLPLLDRGKERRLRKRPFFAAVALFFLACTLMLGLLGYLAERELTIFGATYRFTTKGFPVRVAAADPGATGAVDEGAGGGGVAAQEESTAGGDETVASEETTGDPVPLQAAGTCGICHEDEQDEWIGSVHHKAGIKCVGCHGGVDASLPEKFPAQLETLLGELERLEQAAEDRDEQFWPDEIEFDDDKRLYLFAHQGILVNKRGQVTAPRKPQHAEFCGAQCHQGVLAQFRDAAISHVDEAPSKACVSCHDNHEVFAAGPTTYEEGYQGSDTEKGKRFLEIRDLFGALDAHVDRVSQSLSGLEELAYPTGPLDEELEALAKKAAQLRPLVHSLEPESVRNGNDELTGATAIHGQLDKLAADVTRIVEARGQRWVFVVLVWCVALLVGAALAWRLRQLPRPGRRGGEEPEDTVREAIEKIEALDERSALLNPLPEDDDEPREPT